MDKNTGKKISPPVSPVGNTRGMIGGKRKTKKEILSECLCLMEQAEKHMIRIQSYRDGERCKPLITGLDIFISNFKTKASQILGSRI